MQIAWDAVPSTDIYKVSVFIDGTSSPIDGYNRKETNDTSMVVKGLIPGNKYYFKIYVENDCGENQWNLSCKPYCASRKSFQCCAGACTLYGFRISWDNLHGIDSYEIEVTKSLDTNGDPDFSKSIQNYNPATSSVNFLIVTQLEAGTKYYFRVIEKMKGVKESFQM